MAFSEAVALKDTGQFDALLWSEAGGDERLVALLKGLIARESAWNVGAFRWEPALGEGSVGLMQVLPSTASAVLGRPVTPSDLFVPETNIAAGAGYLRDQLRRYGGDERQAVSAYNAGSARLDLNAAYVQDVLAYRDWYLARSRVPPPPPPSEPGGALVEGETTGDETAPPAPPLWDEPMLAGGIALALGAALLLLRPPRRRGAR